MFSRGEQWRRTHLAIVDALAARDPELVRHRVYDHLRQSRDDLLRHVARVDGAAEIRGGEEPVR